MQERKDRVASAGVAPQRLGSTVGLRGARARAGRSPRARDARRTGTQPSVTAFRPVGWHRHRSGATGRSAPSAAAAQPNYRKSGTSEADGRTTQRNPTCDVDVSTACAMRAAGR
jgi:hypothetical protein